MTDMKDIKTDISDIQEHLKSLKLELSTVQANINGVLNRLNELEPALDLEKEYTFQEAAQLAFENPGWVFYTKCTGRQIADYTRGFYHKDGDAGNYYSITHNNEINKRDDFFAPAPEDFTAVWHRIK